MKKITFCFFITLLPFCSLFAQMPNWSVNENDYQYTMTFVAKLNIDGKQLIGSNDRVGAFVGTTCRGISGVSYIASQNSYYSYLTLFSNTQNEEIYFKLYDSSIDKITVVTKKVVFEANAHKGNLFQSYSIAEPELNNKADIISFSFKDITTVATLINPNSVVIRLYENDVITNLNPIFSLSKGAQLFKNRVIQNSGGTPTDFSTAVTYEVLSEDESTLKAYTVEVDKTARQTLFYKKDVVCNTLGAIKVVSSQEGETVTISANGTTVITKKISNGTVVFPNLEVNSYIVTIGNEWKLVNIDLKN
jgi:hypothetical protein